MRRLLVLGFLAIGSLGTAHAADAPSLLGTWTGKGPSISNEAGWETERAYTLVITEQRGQVFKGHSEYTGGQEDIFGVIRADGRSVLIDDDDGMFALSLLGPDSMEVCYVEAGADAIATCTTLARAK